MEAIFKIRQMWINVSNHLLQNVVCAKPYGAYRGRINQIYTQLCLRKLETVDHITKTSLKGKIFIIFLPGHIDLNLKLVFEIIKSMCIYGIIPTLIYV